MANNPVTRLYELVKAFQARPKEKVDQALAVVLKTPIVNYSLLMREISSVYQLVEASKSIVLKYENLDPVKYLQPIELVETSLRGLNLSAQVVNTTLGKFPADKMAYLDMTGDYLSMHSPEPTISDENRNKIFDAITKVQEEINEMADLPEELSHFIFNKLDDLQQAVRMYEISGAYPVKETVESLLGAAILEGARHKESPAFKEALTKVCKCAAFTYASIQFVNNVTQLPETFTKLISFIGGGNGE